MPFPFPSPSSANENDVINNDNDVQLLNLTSSSSGASNLSLTPVVCAEEGEDQINDKVVMGGEEECDRDVVTAEWLAERLEEQKVLVIDCRGPSDFHTSHIEGAIHLAIPSLMLRRLKRGLLSLDTVIKSQEGKQPWPARWKSQTIVVYEDSGDDDSSGKNASIGYLILRKLQEDGCHVRMLKGGFSSFESIHPSHCAGAKDCDTTSILGLRNLQISDTEDGSGDIPPTPNSSSTFPVEVLPYLFLGNAKNSADLDCLYRNGIRYIVNVTPNMPNTFEEDSSFSYLQIPINDHWSQNLAQYFPGAIAFIDEARTKKCGVLVHCLAGISRSVTVTVAYLMSSLSLSLNDAYDFVKRCKPNISPNFNFMGQLLDFEQTLITSRDCGCQQQHNHHHGNKDSVGHEVGLLCTCSCNKEAKTYFSSPTSTSSSVSSTSSSTSAMTSSSSTAFDYDIPPTPS